MHLNKTVSLIMPIYKKAGSIKRILEGLLNTTESIDEFIFIIDGDFDDTGEIVQNWCSRQTINFKIVHADDINEVLCCIQGASVATSDILIFVQDDMLFYEKQWDVTLCSLVMKYGLVGGRQGSEFSLIINRQGEKELKWTASLGRDTKIGNLALFLYKRLGLDIRFFTCGRRTYVNRGPYVITKERYQDLGGFDPIFAPMDFDCLDLSCKHTRKYGKPYVFPVGYDEYHGSKKSSSSSSQISRASVLKNMPIIISRHTDLVS